MEMRELPIPPVDMMERLERFKEPWKENAATLNGYKIAVRDKNLNGVFEFKVENTTQTPNTILFVSEPFTSPSNLQLVEMFLLNGKGHYIFSQPIDLELFQGHSRNFVFELDKSV